MATRYYYQPTTLATAATTSVTANGTGSMSLPANGVLTSLQISLSVVSQGPCFAKIGYGWLISQPNILGIQWLAEGTMRSDAQITGIESVYWTGHIGMQPQAPNYACFAVRNDTGSVVSFTPVAGVQL